MADGDVTEPDTSDPQQMLAALYDACAADLYRYALVILADHGAAEDALHEAFARLAARSHRLREIACGKQYLRTVVRNECYRIWHDRARQNPTGEMVAKEPILEPAADGAIDDDLLRRIERALAGLPPEQREVVHLKIYEGMTFHQIADTVGISLNTAASRYRYAMARLRRAFPAEEGDDHA